MIVVDVSVLFGLVVKRDAYHALAMGARRRDPDWQATRLFRSEFRSIAAGHLRRGEPLQNVMAAAANAQLAVTTHELTDQEVFAVIQESSLSAYDAEYVALARRLGVVLVTTDREILGHYPNLAVRLQDYARTKIR
ncbi:MAG: type II toxin-antitoxin system VapC family toxin [Verrucomicrobiae bacterium]|nr:type II toxin-antitoxin system VapC family toxin [Verrucomicrobiae bacterium]